MTNSSKYLGKGQIWEENKNTITIYAWDIVIHAGNVKKNVKILNLKTVATEHIFEHFKGHLLNFLSNLTTRMNPQHVNKDHIAVCKTILMYNSYIGIVNISQAILY